jgi:uncharacterized membrane protein YhaH (DUF805 family)
MTLLESIKICFQKYVAFNGRAKRTEFWYFFLFTCLGAICLSILDMAIFPRNEVGVLSLIFTVLTFLPYISVTCRRLHDTNRSGWWQGLPYAVMLFAGFLTIISETLLMIGIVAGIGTGIMLIVWLATIGDGTKNRFGPSIR